MLNSGHERRRDSRRRRMRIATFNVNGINGHLPVLPR